MTIPTQAMPWPFQNPVQDGPRSAYSCAIFLASGMERRTLKSGSRAITSSRCSGSKALISNKKLSDQGQKRERQGPSLFYLHSAVRVEAQVSYFLVTYK